MAAAEQQSAANDGKLPNHFRHRLIASKPLFILAALRASALPVAWMDVDLEFHQFPELFLDGSWPEGPRDVALFNFWANETNLTNRHTPNIGSAVAYFNTTYRAKKLLNAWAEAMQYGTNSEAPDDQVLDTLLKEGGWLERVSLGWLPSSYLRLMPSFYRGVRAVIDHDHGSAPGIDGHSRVKPKLPPTLWTEPVNEEAYMSADAIAAAAAAADPYAVGADDPNAAPAPVQAPAPVAVQAPAPEAVPAPAVATPAPTPEPVVCKAISPQADDEWCDGSCNNDPDDGGCIKFCECGPKSRMERLAAVPAVRSGEWTPAERARWLERHNAGSP